MIAYYTIENIEKIRMLKAEIACFMNNKKKQVFIIRILILMLNQFQMMKRF